MALPLLRKINFFANIEENTKLMLCTAETNCPASYLPFLLDLQYLAPAPRFQIWFVEAHHTCFLLHIRKQEWWPLKSLVVLRSPRRYHSPATSALVTRCLATRADHRLVPSAWAPPPPLPTAFAPRFSSPVVTRRGFALSSRSTILLGSFDFFLYSRI